jgi:hypothetical protein
MNWLPTAVKIPSHFQAHKFFHSFGNILKSWYVHEETRRKTGCWKLIKGQFFQDFAFSSKSLEISLVP